MDAVSVNIRQCYPKHQSQYITRIAILDRPYEYQQCASYYQGNHFDSYFLFIPYDL